MHIVSDAMVIIGCAKLDAFRLLSDLYRSIVVPEAVFAEVALAKPSAFEVPAILKRFEQGFLKKYRVQDRALVNSLAVSLGRGESEAIAAAVELRNCLLLTDEKAGRKVAAQLQVPCTGLLGILREAKKRSLISMVRPSVEQLQRHRITIGEAEAQRFYREEGEA